MSFETISNKIHDWFIESKRDLPWRIEKSPYKVWVSEVMLQQTQVAVVLEYFKKWIRLFPTVHALANAPIDQVIKCWEGLGYYSRARNLHKGAQYILETNSGQFPTSYEELIQIPGVGPYTARAIQAFAFGQHACPVDGNIKRVISRLYAIKDPIDKASTLKLIQQYGDQLLQGKSPEVIAEGLIEFGALICKKNPQCQECPLSFHCQAFKAGLTEVLPNSKKRTPAVPLKRQLLFIMTPEKILLQKVPHGKIMAGLYMPPFISHSENESTSHEESTIYSKLQSLDYQKDVLKKRQHGFTKYKVSLQPEAYLINEVFDAKGFEWINLNQVEKLSFPAGVRQSIEDALKAHQASCNSK